jgi:dephospho-CoA kinase
MKKIEFAEFKDNRGKLIAIEYFGNCPFEIKRIFYIYDVPLLFERGIDSKVDLIIVVYAPRETQIRRVIERDHCSPDLTKKILNEQMDIEEKRTKANFIIKNQGSKKELAVEVDQLLLELMN